MSSISQFFQREGLPGFLTRNCTVRFCEPLQIWGTEALGPVDVFYNSETHQLGLSLDAQFAPEAEDAWLSCGSLADWWVIPGVEMDLTPALNQFFEELCLDDGDYVVFVQEQTTTWLLLTISPVAMKMAV